MRLFTVGTIAVLAVILLIVAGCTKGSSITGQVQKDGLGKEKQDNGITTETKNAQQKYEETLASVIADGTYTENVTYAYHSGTETVDISVTVKDDVVLAASVTGINPNRISQRYIDGVNAALPDLVVGKKINQLNLPTQISGSSLTTAAFKQEIENMIERY